VAELCLKSSTNASHAGGQATVMPVLAPFLLGMLWFGSLNQSLAGDWVLIPRPLAIIPLSS
jgi:hypothetical protein